MELGNKKKKYGLLCILVLAFCAVCVFLTVQSMRKAEQSRQALEELQAESTEEAVKEAAPEETEQAETEKTEPEEKNFCEPVYDFEELKESNQDIYAWITVPGTQVDYPILQSERDNYYLDYNQNGSKGYPGCIYSNKCNAKDFSDYNTVLYGHNMKNGTMFGSIHKFENEDFFGENRFIYVCTEENRLTYEIIASVKFTDVYIPADYEVGTAGGRDRFFEALMKYEGDGVSHFAGNVELEQEDKLLTLSTCVNGERHRRYLVIGKLVLTEQYRKAAPRREAEKQVNVLQ